MLFFGSDDLIGFHLSGSERMSLYEGVEFVCRRISFQVPVDISDGMYS